MKRKRITVSVISELTTDQRVIRICTTLQNMGFDVLVIARAFADSLPLDQYSFQAKRLRCYFRKGFLQYAEFNIRLFFRLLFQRTHFFLANDLDTLVPNYLVSRLRRKRLFYDTHEYFTGVPELKSSPVKRRVWKSFENWIFPRLKVVYTVNDSVKDKYRQEYGNDIAVVRNVPVRHYAEPLEMPAHWKGKHILLMQGIGINPGRGGLELLQAIRELPRDYQMVYIGGGTQWEAISAMRIEWQLEDRVDMLAKVPPALLRRYTPLATLGFTLDGFENDNYFLNLPNKLFDYLQAHVPVVATPIPEVKKVIEQYECGICLSSQEPGAMARAIQELMKDQDRYDRLKRNTALAASELCWENEERKLVGIYQPFL